MMPIVCQLVGVLAVVATLAACDADPAPSEPPGSAAAHGLWLFGSPTTSPAASNTYACSTCHRITPQIADVLALSGAPLAGSVFRTQFWGGAERDFLPAINLCRTWFMGASTPWSAQDKDAQALWAWLETLPAGLPDPVSFTVVASVKPLPPGDATQGPTVWQRACAYCHGAAHTGKGRISAQATILPSDFLVGHTKYSADERRLIFAQKVRHGPFLGYGGRMPPFSLEVLPDADLAAVIAWLQL